MFIEKFATREERDTFLEKYFAKRILLEGAPGCFRVAGGIISIYDEAIHFEADSDN
jgi:hypothetical protein